MKNETYTELDQKLRELALTDWPRFVRLMGSSAVNKAKVCLMKRDRRTFRYMAFRTKQAISTVHVQCKKCSD